ncbi:putative serine protease HtrA [Capsicum annuum]
MESDKKLSKFYEKWKQVVWFIQRATVVKEGDHVRIDRIGGGSGFSVSKDGLVFTCYHVIHGANFIFGRMIKDEETEPVVLDLVVSKPDYDIAVLKVRTKVGTETVSYKYAKLSKVPFKVGQTTLCVGNPSALLGTFHFGRIGFPCNNVTLPEGPMEYNPTSLSVTPKYPVHADLRFDKTEETDIHPDLPTIPINNLITAPGCSGAPIFDLKGNVIGMLSSVSRSSSTAIHVVALAVVLRHYLGPRKFVLRHDLEPRKQRHQCFLQMHNFRKFLAFKRKRFIVELVE